MTRDGLALELAQRASQALEPIYERLGRIADEVVQVKPARSSLTESNLTRLQRMLVDFLGEEPAVWGMGFVAAPSVVEGKVRYLLWWQRHGGRIARLRLNFDPASVDVYDYLQMDWYQLALRGQARVAYGPYVDYSGSDMYTITATIPVVADGVFLGVAGADLVVAEVEHRLLAVLRQTSEDVVVVSTERRVIAANTPRWLVGSRLSGLPTAGAQAEQSAFREVVEMPLGTGWLLAVARPQDDDPEV
jgi:Methyl-accepting chemotaxis protein-like, first PDC sensor domain